MSIRAHAGNDRSALPGEFGLTKTSPPHSKVPESSSFSFLLIWLSVLSVCFLFTFFFFCLCRLVPLQFCSRAVLCVVRRGTVTVDAVKTCIYYSLVLSGPNPAPSYLLIALILASPASMYLPSTPPGAPLSPLESIKQQGGKDRRGHHQIINCTICPTSIYIHTSLYTQALLPHTTCTAYKIANVPGTVRYTHP